MTGVPDKAEESVRSGWGAIFGCGWRRYAKVGQLVGRPHFGKSEPGHTRDTRDTRAHEGKRISATGTGYCTVRPGSRRRVFLPVLYCIHSPRCTTCESRSFRASGAPLAARDSGAGPEIVTVTKKHVTKKHVTKTHTHTLTHTKHPTPRGQHRARSTGGPRARHDVLTPDRCPSGCPSDGSLRLTSAE